MDSQFETEEGRKAIKEAVERARKKTNQSILYNCRKANSPAHNVATLPTKKLAVNPKTGKIYSEDDINKKECEVIHIFTKMKKIGNSWVDDGDAHDKI